MATRLTVKKLMKQYLDEKAHDRLEQAGTTWLQQAMGFYFPGNEDTADLCALTVLKQALASDGTTVTSSVKSAVRDLVNTDTVTDDAVKVIWLATFQPA
jgi:hypothetical protein